MKVFSSIADRGAKRSCDKMAGEDADRGLLASHTTIMRYVHQHSAEIEKRIRKFLKLIKD